MYNFEFEIVTALMQCIHRMENAHNVFRFVGEGGNMQYLFLFLM